MSYWEAKRKLEALPPRDRQIWELHQKASNAAGFATQMAEQGAHNSQCKYERAADEATASLWTLLTGAAPETAPATSPQSPLDSEHIGASSEGLPTDTVPSQGGRD